MQKIKMHTHSIPFLGLITGLLACLLVISLVACSPQSQKQAVTVPPVSQAATQVDGAPVAIEPSPSPLPPASLSQPTAAATPAQVSSAWQELLKNFEFRLSTYDKTVKLADGKYTAGSGQDYISAQMLTPLAFGDVNGDGIDDAVVLIAENGGGSGTFVSLVVMGNQGGQPVQTSATLIDDRPVINGLKIDQGKIILDAVIHGDQDPMCCPSLPVSETFRLTNGVLLLRRLASITPMGKERAITITSPVSGAQVSGALPVKGNVTVSPFENNLVYRIFDRAGNLLAEGPIMVNSDGAGGPGDFDAPVDISAIRPGTPFRLELHDLSAADGSTLAMDSVDLITPEP